ncbi:MAG: hypothetical protein F4Y39_21190 [Gemmatimonadetes bacterium]|nr:hypothetical protein [Gemmatimonadota bacterium]MYF75622.1 hypothetical protein [Gemmatimonadota bacterium]
MTDTTRQTWLALRHRIGRDNAITAAQIGADIESDTDDVRASIRALRDQGYQIIYSSRSPVGYHIPASSTEAEKSTARQRAAILSLCRQVILLEGISIESLIADIRTGVSLPGAVGQLLHAKIAEPATKKQIKHLSHLALSSVLLEEEADMAYRNIASAVFTKLSAKVLISDLRERIKTREQARVDSKRRRMAYQSAHHPDQEPDTLIRRDESRVRQVWKKSQEKPDGTDDDTVRGPQPSHPR